MRFGFGVTGRSAWGIAGLILAGLAADRLVAGIQQADKTGEQRAAWLVQVPLPITDAVAARVKQQIGRIADEAPVVVEAGRRPVLILEFDTSHAANGQGSGIGNCLDIALLLTDARLRGLYSVAYVPRARGAVFDDPQGLPASRLEGHAVLVALACNEIAMHEDSAIGRAGADVEGDGSIESTLYSNVAGRRLTVPLPVVLAMVDPGRALYRVETTDGIQFVDQETLNRLEAAGQVIDASTISRPGELPLLTSRDMQQLQLIRNRVGSRRDLASRLKVDPAAIEGNPAAGGQWQAVELPLGNYIDSREAAWTLRMLNSHLNSTPDTNLVIVRLNSPGGDLDASLQVARALAELDSSQVRTVAFVESRAAGGSALVAAFCDQIIMSGEATLGGPDSVEAAEHALDDSRPLIRLLAEEQQIDWSVPMGLVDPDLDVSRYRNRTTGQLRLLSEEELQSLDNPDQWVPLGQVGLATPLTAQQADEMMLSRATLADFDQLLTFYQLESQPLRLQPSPTDRWIEGLARHMATPWIAAWLLFGAVFLLSTEMSHPGIGIPGFLGTICLMLFFWSQYLDGNANWLEILLFATGLVFVVLEVFVLPGFGVFGLGGLVMIVVSIVLASQTFVIPRNSEELARLPVSLSLVLAATGGFFAAIFFIRKYMTTLPVFRRIMLEPPGHDESLSPEQRTMQESVANREHLTGRTGVTTTPLVPAGKARIANELVDVITDGRMIEKDTPVRVVEALGNRVVVEPIAS